MRTPPIATLALAVPFLAAGPNAASAAEQMAEIDQPASTLEEILAHPAEIGGEQREARVVLGTLEPMTAAAWHTHPSPVYLYVDEGTLTMEVEGQEPYDIPAGQAVAEPLDAPMRILNRGTEPVRLVVFQISPPTAEFLEEGTAQSE